LVEQRIENPRVDGSIPSQATKLKSPFQKWLGLFLFRTSGGLWPMGVEPFYRRIHFGTLLP
jgi:hypothetical protein